MKILVCGGREYNDAKRVQEVLDAFSITLLITGMARGADMLGYMYAKNKKIPVLECPADWRSDGKSAGFKRNLRMLDEKPDLVIAFPGGAGTAHTVSNARLRGIPVKEIT